MEVQSSLEDEHGYQSMRWMLTLHSESGSRERWRQRVRERELAVTFLFHTTGNMEWSITYLA